MKDGNTAIPFSIHNLDIKRIGQKVHFTFTTDDEAVHKFIANVACPRSKAYLAAKLLKPLKRETGWLRPMIKKHHPGWLESEDEIQRT